MTNQGIYDGALRMIAETGESGRTDDYEERAPYLLSAFFNENALTDRLYRQFASLPAQGSYSAAFAELDEEYPFCDRTVYAAECYLAAMLILDENQEISDKLYDRYACSMTAMREEIPGAEAAGAAYECGDIVDKYVY